MNGLFDMVVGHSIMRWLEHITITKLINLVGPMHSIKIIFVAKLHFLNNFKFYIYIYISICLKL